jgi:hypothetical protein
MAPDFVDIGGKFSIWQRSSIQERQGIFPGHPPSGRMFGRTDPRDGPAMPLDLKGLAAVLDIVQHLAEPLGGCRRADRPGHAAMISDYPISRYPGYGRAGTSSSVRTWRARTRVCSQTGSHRMMAARVTPPSAGSRACPRPRAGGPCSAGRPCRRSSAAGAAAAAPAAPIAHP